jgi:hypothetical protein
MDDSRDSFGTRCPIFGDSHNSPIIDFDGSGGVIPSKSRYRIRRDRRTMSA